MRIVCPSSTSQILSGGHSSNNISNRVNRRHGNNPDRRTRVAEKERSTRFVQASEAKKRKDKRQQAQGRAKARAFDVDYVFVGNLESSISQERLKEFFQDCGKITRVTIRCSRGQAITAGVAVPLAVRSERDRQYATIEFKDTASARKALAYHGKILDGCQLVVSASAADLPEVHEIVNTHIKRLQQINALPTPKNRQKQPDRPLTANDTERFIDFRQPDNDGFCIFGVRIPKCIA